MDFLRFNRLAWLLAAALILAACRLKPPPPAPEPAEKGRHGGLQLTDPWVLIDAKQKTLIVFKRGSPPRVFKGTALGAANAGEKARRGDDVTPRGRYYIRAVRPSGKFRHFLHLDYPSPADARRALEQGRIDRNTYSLIAQARRLGRLPPQNTPLGGLIGIHGLGRGSPEIHKYINWTAGCVALDNEQIEELVRLVRPGVVVEIR